MECEDEDAYETRFNIGDDSACLDTNSGIDELEYAERRFMSEGVCGADIARTANGSTSESVSNEGRGSR